MLDFRSHNPKKSARRGARPNVCHGCQPEALTTPDGKTQMNARQPSDRPRTSAREEEASPPKDEVHPKETSIQVRPEILALLQDDFTKGRRCAARIEAACETCGRSPLTATTFGYVPIGHEGPPMIRVMLVCSANKEHCFLTEHAIPRI